MPSFERGVYEPPSDDIRVFDDDEQDMDEEGSRLPLLIVIALLVLAAFAGVVWLAYSQGVQRGRADAPRMIVAAPGPVKEAAADGSGSNHSLKIYEQPAPADDADDESVPPPTDTVKPAPSSPMTAAPPISAKPTPEVAAAPKPEIVAPKPTAMAEKPVEKPIAKPAVVAPKPAPVTVAQTAAPTTDVAPPPKPEAAAPKPETAVASGAYVLQIGAYKSQAEADAAWKTYQAKHPIAGGYSEDVRKVDLAGKGTWYRLRIGSFADKAAANSVCDKLKADGGICLLAK